MTSCSDGAAWPLPLLEHDDTQEEIMDDTIEDPVCGMQVSRDSFAIEHLGIHYAFCSQQCQDRFEANPHLYIGVPGEQAPKREGRGGGGRRRGRRGRPGAGGGAAGRGGGGGAGGGSRAM